MVTELHCLPAGFIETFKLRGCSGLTPAASHS
jgi:hypothetical protein